MTTTRPVAAVRRVRPRAAARLDLRRRPSVRRERLRQVRDQVLGILDADRVADQAFGDAHRRALPGVHSTWLVVAGGPTIVSTAPEVGRAGALSADAAARARTASKPPCEHEAQHTAEAAHLLASDVVVRVRGESRIVHLAPTAG